MALLAQHSLSKEGDEGFSMEQAVLFAYCAEGFRVLATAGDIYEGLASLPSIENIQEYEQGIGILTTGWASPLNSKGEPEGAPSEHPLRQRVRLCACVERDGTMGSAVIFQHEPDEPMTDEGEAHGSLADALLSTLYQLIAKNN